MNLLVLSSWFPYPPGNGSRIRAYYLLRELARAGHTIRLVAGLQNDVAGDKDTGIAALRDMGVVEVVTVPWQWYEGGKSGVWGKLRAALSPVPRSILETPNPALWQAIAEQLARPTDAVLVMEMGMDAYLPDRLPPNVPLILDGVEIVEAMRLTDKNNFGRTSSPASFAAKRLARERANKVMRYWPKRFKSYAAVTTVSETEAQATQALCPNLRVQRVPNGVDTSYYGPRDWSAVKTGQLIYNGSPTYGPNRDGVHWFANDVLPLVRKAVPEAELTMTGSYSPEATRELAAREVAHPLTYAPREAEIFLDLEKTVRLTGFVPDLRPLLAQSVACVVPLRNGGGTRLKILEAWAAGVPVIATSIGATGLDGAIPGTHFLQVDVATSYTGDTFKKIGKKENADFANATVRLLTDPVLCRTLSENARALVVERYDWAIVGKMLNDLLLETCRDCKPS